MGRLILAARRDDFEGWMQILVFVAMAVVYALSGILKAVKSQKTEGAKEKTERQRGQPRLGDSASLRQYRVVAQPQHLKIAHPKPDVQQAVQVQPKEPQVKPQLAIQKQKIEAEIQELPEIKPKVEKLREFTSEITKVQEGERVGLGVPVAKYLDEIFLDYADPDELKRAILHYEILGKPLSLRIPDDKIV